MDRVTYFEMLLVEFHQAVIDLVNEEQTGWSTERYQVLQQKVWKLRRDLISYVKDLSYECPAPVEEELSDEKR